MSVVVWIQTVSHSNNIPDFFLKKLILKKVKAWKITQHEKSYILGY